MKRLVLLAASFLGVGSALAVPGPGLTELDSGIVSDREADHYVAFMFGYASPEDSEIESVSGFSVSGVDIELDDDLGYLIAVGTDATVLRAEIEAGYRKFDIAAINSAAAPAIEGSGDVSTYSIMANAYIDIPVASRVDLYVGGGVGAVFVDGDITITDGVDTASDRSDTWEFAYQGMAGISVLLADNVTLTGGYRIFSFTDPNFGGTVYDAPFIHSVEIGLRLGF